MYRQHGQYTIYILFAIIMCDAKRLSHTTVESSGQCGKRGQKKLIMSIITTYCDAEFKVHWTTWGITIFITAHSKLYSVNTVSEFRHC